MVTLNPVHRQSVFTDIAKDVMRDRREQEMNVYRQFIKDRVFQNVLIQNLVRAVGFEL